MSDDILNNLKPKLEEIDPQDVREPAMPMPIALQEDNDLATFVSRGDVREKLVAVGIPAEGLDSLPNVVKATRTSQSNWVVQRDRSKTDAQKEREEAAYSYRGHILAACRWNLRRDRRGLATVDAIANGEGVADLIQDLRDLASLVDDRRPAFELDTTFDPEAKAEAARSSASDLEAGLTAERLRDDQAKSKDTRDRAYTYLAGQVGEIREAGRYAFRDDAEMKARFASTYLRAKRRKRNQPSVPKAGPEPGEPSEPSTPSEPDE